ncbi:hypothetical protein Cgig2_011204 [Carnegiea gigantea]|uniref:Protein kinase domain-containing protein n=1 Tax=Carnegiea gigantea TaxID=171969 RepID=A0A9Q1KG92_9CARY|nr:hypothetical protein Cgig2_011204 [Carnegiea gigantea]
MFFCCLCTRRRSPVIPPHEAVAAPPTLSDASTLDTSQAPLYRPTASDISARRATGTATAATTNTRPRPEYGADVRIAGRRASTWEESLAESSGARSSASCIAGRRATKMGDGPPSDTSAGPPPDHRSSSWAWMSKIAAIPFRAAGAVVGADGQKMRKNVELTRECWAPKDVPDPNITSRKFTFDELATATLNFSNNFFLGAGGFARVYKGYLQDGQVVAVKRMHKDGSQHKQFVVEALTLSRLHHPNLVNLIGYCADGDQRLLVYEYMPLGSLEDHLHGLEIRSTDLVMISDDRLMCKMGFIMSCVNESLDPVCYTYSYRRDREPIDWNTRMKIAAGAARGLEYLHEKATPQLIYRDFKPSNVLLDEDYHPKLSDFGLAKHAPMGDKAHTTTEVRGTFGFWAPEYVMSGHLTKKSDVYSFGVVFLELITGLTVIDDNRPDGEQNLVEWARTLLHDQCESMKLADPRLQGQFPKKDLYGALAIASMCIQENAARRPTIGDVVNGLSYLADQANDPNPNAKCGRTSVEEVGGSGCKWELERSEQEDSASVLPGSLEKEDSGKMLHRNVDKEGNIAETEMWGVKLAGKEENRINTDSINQPHEMKIS